ncbi:Homoserine dehydrogenase, partial [Oleoguttula sp. CCFEE 5521]
MAPGKTVYIGIIGVGGVGQAFLGQLAQLQRRLAKRDPPTSLSLVLVRRSTKQLTSPDYKPIEVSSALAELDKVTGPYPQLNDAITYLAKAPGKAVLVDNTSDLKDVALGYPDILRRGISIVTPNKKAFSHT